MPLKLSNISLQIQGQQLFAPFSATIVDGNCLTLMGPSGSGKSSILGYVSGTLAPVFQASGDVELNGRSLLGLRPEKRNIGILFQDDLLFPHMTVAQNLGFGLKAEHKNKQDRMHRISTALSQAGLKGFENRMPSTLSGGQRSRVALMRTLLAEPTALLLDEPFSKLDQNLRQEFRAFVFHHARQNNLPTILVTHDPADAEAADGQSIELKSI